MPGGHHTFTVNPEPDCALWQMAQVAGIRASLPPGLESGLVGGNWRGGGAEDPMAAVLTQEIHRLAPISSKLCMLLTCLQHAVSDHTGPGRYRQLGRAVHASLVDLERALQGLAAMSTDLEQMSASLAGGQACPLHGFAK